MHISEVKTSPPFNELFDIKEEVVEAIAENMLGYGFDAARPIVLWADKKIVIDGHTRLEAARRAGLVQIYCREFPFRDEDTALEYAIHNQRNRRNITESELLRCIEAVDKRREAERDDRGKFTVAPSGAPGKSAETTAKIVGTSHRKVERARAILSDPEEKTAVMTGKKSINWASRDAKEKRQPAPPANELIVPNQDKRQEVLLQAWEEIKAWRQKYSQYPEFKEIFWAIDALADKGKV